MLYDGLSANAKGWLLAKHHFATPSIFQKLVKGSAPTSLLPTTPLFFCTFTRDSEEQRKKKNPTRALKVQRGVRGLVDGQSFWTVRYTKRNEMQHKKTSQPSIVTRAPCLSFSLGETSHDSLLTSPLCRMHSAKPRTFML